MIPPPAGRSALLGGVLRQLLELDPDRRLSAAALLSALSQAQVRLSLDLGSLSGAHALARGSPASALPAAPTAYCDQALFKPPVKHGAPPRVLGSLWAGTRTSLSRA